MPYIYTIIADSPPLPLLPQILGHLRFLCFRVFFLQMVSRELAVVIERGVVLVVVRFGLLLHSRQRYGLRH